MIDQPVSATRYAPRQLTGHAILSTALAPLLGMGAVVDGAGEDHGSNFW